ncbi:quinone oxidoreductase [Xylaria venustula]|nr:quinone oxidoreductase [Xylaria venustula]
MSGPRASQTVLLLHAPKQSYQVSEDYATPRIDNGSELLVRTQVIGLNPIDWKAPDFGFGIPVLPYIAGRELVGQVVRTSGSTNRFQEGDQNMSINRSHQVIVISTDYRDLRKAAFQEYVVASDFNVVKLPPTVTPHAGASLGVAFVAAALSLGVCMGLSFQNIADGPDLLKLIRKLDRNILSEDIQSDCFDTLDITQRAGPGDWIAIWGGSSTTASIASQLARLAGLHVLLIANQAKHGMRLAKNSALRPDMLVDSYDQARAVEIIQGSLGGKLRFGLDTQGRDSAEALGRSMKARESVIGSLITPPHTPTTTHLVGLAALPNAAAAGGLIYHRVPIKLFHEVPQVGSAITLWLETLLEKNVIALPDVLAIEEGFCGVNRGLNRMRRGEISGGRAVVDLTAGLAPSDTLRVETVIPEDITSALRDGCRARGIRLSAALHASVIVSAAKHHQPSTDGVATYKS